MDIKQIRESGLLELYVLGQCSRVEIEVVEQALVDFPELKIDLYQIGAGLEKYAKLHELRPTEGVKENLLEQVRQSNRSGGKGSSRPDQANKAGWPMWLTSLLGIIALALGYLYYNGTQDYEQLRKQYDEAQQRCDSIQRSADLQYALMDQLQDPDNQLLPMSATDKYSETDLYLVYNEEEQFAFLQVNNLPPITDRQSYQLWSLKANQAPIPLTVFQGDEGVIIPLDFEAGTGTYAITIEQLGGAAAPTLADLISTVTVTS